MSRELYNFIWVPGRKGNAIRIGAETDRVEGTVHKPKEAVILYPTLFSPAVYVQDRAARVVELLIAAKEELVVADVNVHLKISLGLDPEKAFDPRPLFANPEGLIILKATKKNGDGILHTERRFSGILSAQAEKLNAAYSHIYKVEVAESAIPATCPALMEKLSSRMTVGDVANAIVGQEPQDVTIAAFLENAGEQGGDSGPVPGFRRYGFKVADNGVVDLSQPNPDEPIQTYHPLFVWSADSAVANLGHISDIHLNARLDILCGSSACVVEDPAHLSPEVGKLLVNNNRSFASVLAKMREAKSVHGIAIGGDLIDHIRNTYNRQLFVAAEPGEKRIAKIWSAVGLEDAGRNDRYPAGTDYLLFYSMIVDFCRRSKKPVFGLSGNHDAYEEPFGISPRALGQRANAGIPADLNLTFYEAILSFGPSWPTVVQALDFKKDWFAWFYQVFGGFNDFIVRLPQQTVVALGWGEAEDMITPPQGAGHLPRAVKAVTDGQLALLKLAPPSKVVLFTHFTFVSYREEVANVDEKKKEATSTVLTRDLNKYNMGTFETNREAMIELLSKPQVEVAIAGHSHRRGTYQVTGKKTVVIPPTAGELLLGQPGSVADGLGVTMHDTETVGSQVINFIKPVIVVSDSGGPMPRLNKKGELKDFGSDLAGGTVATFATDGTLAALSIVRSDGARPRIAVSLDYFDITKDSVFSDEIRTGYVHPADQAAALASATPIALHTVTLPWEPELFERIKLSATAFTLHGVLGSGDALEWVRIDLERTDDRGRTWRVPANKTKDFHNWATSGVQCFVGLVTQSADEDLKKHYDWEDPWYFEVEVHSTGMGRGKDRIGFAWKRPSRKAENSFLGDFEFKEIPDFEWRRKNLKDKYS